MSNWRVIHFSTGYTGGAAIAAKSLDQALKSNGVNSELFFLSRPGRSSTNLLKRSLSENLISRIYTLISSFLSKRVLFTLFSAKLSSLNRLVYKLDPNSTILHFHNWFNMGNSSQFNELANQGYKIVFTLHDERTYTGGCHYAINCEGFQLNCNECPLIPELFKYAPKIALQKTCRDMKNIQATFVAPSEWIQNRALASEVLKNARVIHIPNYISSPGLLDNSTKLAISSDSEIILGIGSMNPFDKVKGGELVKEVLRNQSDFKVIFLKDFEKSESFWSEIDYLFVPSQIDNSPNVIHESKLRGIPIIASFVGGITELMGERDIELKDISYDSFIYALTKARKIKSEELMRTVRDEMEEYRKNSIKLHIEEYERLLVK